MADPPITLTDKDGSETTFLFNTEENMNQRDSDPTVDAIYSFNSDQVFIVSLEESAQFEIRGKATGFRIATYSGYSDDPLTALAEYAARLLAHVNGNQGTGWTLENTYTNVTLDCVIEEIQIIRRRSEKFEFEWNLTARAGRGMMPHQTLSPETVNTSTTATLGGTDLHDIEELMITKSQRLRVHTYVTAGTALSVEDNEIEARSGARRDVAIRGKVPGSESVRDSFDTNIRSYIGTDNTETFDSPFPGQDYTVMVISHDSTREAGITQVGDYYTEVVEGGGFA